MEMRISFAKDLEEVACEAIHFCVIGDGSPRDIPKEKKGKVLPWSDAFGLLDYAYDDGYGGADCHAVYCYTQNYIVFVGEYDGSTWPERIPRSPMECTPSMI